MKTRSNIMRCAMAAIAIAVAMAAHSLTQGGDDNTAPAEAYYGHGCCGYSRARAGHHGCRPAPPSHNRRGHHGCGHANSHGRGYHCDGSHACYHGYGIKDADPETFTDLGGGLRQGLAPRILRRAGHRRRRRKDIQAHRPGRGQGQAQHIHRRTED